MCTCAICTNNVTQLPIMVVLGQSPTSEQSLVSCSLPSLLPASATWCNRTVGSSPLVSASLWLLMTKSSNHEQLLMLESTEARFTVSVHFSAGITLFFLTTDGQVFPIWECQWVCHWCHLLMLLIFKMLLLYQIPPHSEERTLYQHCFLLSLGP